MNGLLRKGQIWNCTKVTNEPDNDKKYQYSIKEDGYPIEKQSPYFYSDKTNLEINHPNITYLRDDDQIEVSFIRPANCAFLFNVFDFSDYNFRNSLCNEKCHENDTITNAQLYPLDDVAEKCYDRLNEIQKGSQSDNVDRSYNCERLMYYYFCKYGKIYCSEIYKALEKVNDLKNSASYPYYKILSFGCGASVDLLAFDYLRKKDHNYKELSYYGLDMSPYWKPLQNFIKNNINVADADHPIKVEYLNGAEANVTTYFDNHPPLKGYNIFIASYLMSILEKQVYNEVGSYFCNEFKTKFRDLFDKWIQYIIAQKPKDSKMLIIINDVAGTHAIDLFEKELEGNQYGLKLAVKDDGTPLIQRYFFNWDYQPRYISSKHVYTQRLDSDSVFDHDDNKDQTNLYLPENEINYYNPMTACQSNQLIIEVE